MSKVWLLTKGEYSDYSVAAVFSNKQAAETVLAIARSSGSQMGASSYNDLEEYDLLDAVVEPAIERRISSDLLPSGHLPNKSDMRIPFFPWDWREPVKCDVQRLPWQRSYIHEDVRATIRVWGTDHELVEKTFDACVDTTLRTRRGE